jgi:uncharacterized membrane protein
MMAMLATAWGQGLEAGMLICFGASWPLAIAKTLRTRQVAGVSGKFMTIVLVGYLLGITAKIVKAAPVGQWPEPVIALYALNALLVGFELMLYLRYKKRGLETEQ